MIHHLARLILRREHGALRARVHDLDGRCRELTGHLAATLHRTVELEAENDRLRALAGNVGPTPTTPPRPEEGGPCPNPGCSGKLEWVRRGDCTCHISPPCESCVSSPLVCDECEWESK